MILPRRGWLDRTLGDSLWQVKDACACGGSNQRRMKDSAQMALVEDDDVVQTLPPDRTDESLDVGVLPG